MSKDLSPTPAPAHAAASAWAPFRHRTFAVIWVATVVSNIGGWMYSVASGWLMTSLDADPLFVSLVQVANNLPMFLFATTFYPLGVYPRPVQIVVECLPLYSSIELLRDLALGTVGPALLWPALYLAVMGVAALVVALPRLTRTLMP